jgi:outer membrane protein OmpA-like peptidoglycan-associated protein
MSRAAVVQASPQVQPLAEAESGILQRSCECGQHTGGGECAECRKKRERFHGSVIQSGAGSRSVKTRGVIQSSRLPASHDFSRVPVSAELQVQPTLRIGSPGDAFEREAERVADTVMRMPGSAVGDSTACRHVVQRKCSACADEARAAAANRDDEEKTGARSAPRGIGAPAWLNSALDALDGSGRPLAGQTRSFFESRMGHDFGNVRVHTGTRADGLARSVQARAFTWGNHIVFGAGEYAEGTSAGGHLLAHELTHTIQQGAAAPMPGRDAEAAAPLGIHGMTRRAGVQQLQRFCRDLAAPPAMTCNIGAASPANPGTFVEFGQNSSALTPAAQATVQSVAAVWRAGGGVDVLTVHGFASIEGQETLNCPLSCDRAEAVKAELVAPANGVPAVNVQTVAHGETDEFSASLPPNRRAVITTTGGAAAPIETITSQTVEPTPAPRTRTTIGVGEDVTLTHVPGVAAWATTGGTLSAAAGVTVILTAPDTAQRVTVTAGAANIAFDVLAPTSVAMTREPGTGVKHAVGRPDSGIQTRVFLGPDTVNFTRARYRELDVDPTTTGVYSCFGAGTGHCGAGGGGAPCPDKALTNTVVAGLGTQSLLGDCAYSGDCGTAAPFAAGGLTYSIPYEYRVGAGAFHAIVNVPQLHFHFFGGLSTGKAGALGTTTVGSATVTIPACP